VHSPPSLPYKVDTPRPSRRTNWTRLVPFPQVHLYAFAKSADPGECKADIARRAVAALGCGRRGARERVRGVRGRLPGVAVGLSAWG
jgi:hypothetical protein